MNKKLTKLGLKMGKNKKNNCRPLKYPTGAAKFEDSSEQAILESPYLSNILDKIGN
jgi:hypothetical protein